MAEKLHAQFGHPPMKKLQKVVKRAGLGNDKNLMQEISEISKTCKICKEFTKPSPTPVVGMPHAEHFRVIPWMCQPNGFLATLPKWGLLYITRSRNSSALRIWKQNFKKLKNKKVIKKNIRQGENVQKGTYVWCIFYASWTVLMQIIIIYLDSICLGDTFKAFISFVRFFIFI